MGPRRSHTARCLVIFGCLVLLLYGKALLTSRVLSQADYLLTLPPWDQYRPAGDAPPQNPLLSDQSFQVIPYLYYLQRSMSEGRVPLWNPHIMTGMPFLANMQSGVFFPLYWLVWILPVADALEWIAALKVLIAFLGIYLFCVRALELRPVAAFCGGVIYALCAFNTVWLLYSITGVSMLAGWILLGAHRVVVRGSLPDFLGLATAAGLAIAAGHPETVLHLLLITAIYVMSVLWRRPERVGGSLWKLPLAGTMAAALAAVVLVPFVEAGLSSATLQTRGMVQHAFTPWYAAIVALIPNFFGNPAAGFYQGPNNYNEIAVFCSVSGWMLAGIALMLGLRRAGTIFASSVILLSALIVYRLEPLFTWFHKLPFYGDTINSRLSLGISLGFSILAAIGIEIVAGGQGSGEWKRVRNAATVGAVALLLAAAPFLGARLATLAADKPRAEYTAVQILWFLLSVGVSLALVAWRSSGSSASKLAALCWALWISVEMVHFAAGYNPVIPRSSFVFEYTPPAARFLQGRPTERFMGVSFGEMAPNSAVVYGLSDFRGYDFPEPAEYGDYFYGLIDGSSRLNLTHDVLNWTPGAIQALANASVRYYVHREAVVYPGMSLVHDGDLKIYEFDKALPRAYCPVRVSRVGSRAEALDAMKRRGFDGSQTALVVAGEADGLPTGSPPDARVRIQSYRPESVVLQAHASAPAVVVLTDLAAAGWRATVNGTPARIYNANAMFRAVAVPAGESSIRFEYRPQGYAVGKMISSGALALLVLLGAWAAKGSIEDRRGS